MPMVPVSSPRSAFTDPMVTDGVVTPFAALRPPSTWAFPVECRLVTCSGPMLSPERFTLPATLALVVLRSLWDAFVAISAASAVEALSSVAKRAASSPSVSSAAGAALISAVIRSTTYCCVAKPDRS